MAAEDSRRFRLHKIWSILLSFLKHREHFVALPGKSAAKDVSHVIVFIKSYCNTFKVQNSLTILDA